MNVRETSGETRLERFDRALRDSFGWLLYRTGLAWLTPFVGVVDFSDLEQLRGQILRELAWLDGLIEDGAEGAPVRLEKMRQVRASFETLVGAPKREPRERLAIGVHPVRWPWLG
jgi:hypothetical protein